MKVLIGCEESQEVCKAFRAKGHDAYSCDLQECSGGHPEWHLKMDIKTAIKLKKWDLAIYFPPCTYLTVSANKWYKDQPPRKSGVLVGSERRKAREESINFFMYLATSNIKRIAIENPIGIMSSFYRKPDQIIQPWMFGHGEPEAIEIYKTTGKCTAGLFNGMGTCSQVVYQFEIVTQNKLSISFVPYLFITSILNNVFQDVILVILLIIGLYTIFRPKTLFVKSKKRHYMNVTIRILKEDLTLAQQKTIQDALGIADKKDLGGALEKIGKAAFLEYCKMIVENGTPSKIDDIREARLFLLIQHYFENRLPNENEVEQIFHLSNKSKGLLKGTISHYKTRLTKFNSFLLTYLSKATQNDNTTYYEFECKSITIIEELNSIVKDNWSSHELIKRVPNSASMFHCHPDTHQKLKDYLK